MLVPHKQNCEILRNRSSSSVLSKSKCPPPHMSAYLRAQTQVPLTPHKSDANLLRCLFQMSVHTLLCLHRVQILYDEYFALSTPSKIWHTQVVQYRSSFYVIVKERPGQTSYCFHNHIRSGYILTTQNWSQCFVQNNKTRTHTHTRTRLLAKITTQTFSVKKRSVFLAGWRNLTFFIVSKPEKKQVQFLAGIYQGIHPGTRQICVNVRLPGEVIPFLIASFIECSG